MRDAARRFDRRAHRNGLKVLNHGDAKSVAGFERKLPPSSPQIKGKDVDLAKAIEQAAKLIGKAELPMFGGLATDVEGMRAVMALAERSGGIVDHAFSEAQYRNFKILQTSGWVMSTITEARNRADLFIIAGSDIHKLHPRFFERVVSPPDSMFDVEPPKRTVVFIGKGLDRSGAKGTRIGEVVTLACPDERAGEVVALLRARLRGFRVKPSKLDGVTLAEIDALAERCSNAKYGVVVWAPPALNFPFAELAVDQFAGLVKDLNQTIRFAGLALGGAEGAITAGARLHLDQRLSASRQLCERRARLRSLPLEHRPDAEGGRGRPSRVDRVDLAGACRRPKTKLPTIVLGTPGLKLASEPAVFIPVGTPGVDHAGRLIRVDNVVSLPLKDLGRADLPRAADVLSAIEAAL